MLNCDNFPSGSLITLSVAITNQKTGLPADPTEVQLAVTQPDGSVVIFSYLDGQVIRDGVGLYHYDYLPPGPGRYSYAWEGTGAVAVGTCDTPFFVDASGFAP